MGYDHFALIALAEKPTDEDLKVIENACKELSYIYDDILFGKVYHLTSGSFGEYWWDLFDDFMSQLYNQTGIEKLHLYVCEFDGESLQRHEYIKGKKEKHKEIIVTTNDTCVRCCWDVNTLIVDHNVTTFYNSNYYYDYQ